ncbi:MAG: NfeD family protein, partial [Methanomicrobia archaeon]|nr:NfeD family protein [Methanomicrobia archaeon]
MDIITVLWIILAVVLFVGEILTPSFFLIWFSIGAAISALASYLNASFTLQGIIFSAHSFILRRFLR